MWWYGMRSGWTAIRAAVVPLVATGIGLGGVLVLAPEAGAQLGSPARALVDTPTAGLLPSGTFETRPRIFPGGGLDLRLDIALARRLSLGAGYGGVQIIGDGEPDWYPEPGFFVKARILEEDYAYPAIAIGIDTQGSGYYDKSRDRYQYKSRGFYIVASKNYAWYGDLTLHGGFSRSLEDRDDKDVTPFVGFEKSLGGAVGLALEYDLASNDNRTDGAFGEGQGYLNGALRWNLAPQMQLRLVIRDMLDNSESVDPRFADVIIDEGWGREFSFSYVESF
jgi:hypothetical protein